MSSMRSLFILALLSAPGGVAAENEATQVSPQLRQRAEDLAGAASKRFTDLLDGRQRTAQVRPSDTCHRERDGTFAPVWDWLARSAQAYDDVVIAQMKEKDGWTVIVQRNDKAPPPAAQTTPTPADVEEPQRELRGWSGLVEVVRDWLARANRSYRTEIVKPLLEPVPGAEPPSEIATQPPPQRRPRPWVRPLHRRQLPAQARMMRPPSASSRKPRPRIPTAPSTRPRRRARRKTRSGSLSRRKPSARRRLTLNASPMRRRRSAGLERISGSRPKPSARPTTRSASPPKPKPSKADEAKRVAAEAAARRKADDEKRVAAEAEAKRKADEDKRVAAEAEAKRKADDEKRAAAEAEAKRKADEEKRIAAEAAAKRKADDVKREAEAADAAERRAVAASRGRGQTPGRHRRRCDAALGSCSARQGACQGDSPSRGHAAGAGNPADDGYFARCGATRHHADDALCESADGGRRLDVTWRRLQGELRRRQSAVCSGAETEGTRARA